MADSLDSLRLLQRLEYLQSDLYTRALAATGFVPAADRTVFETLNQQDTAHIGTLSTLITTRLGTPVVRPTFDFTGKGAVPGFAFATGQYETFRMLAQAFEDLAVRAYTGQVQALQSDKGALTFVLAMHSVEGRHAAEVRRIRGRKGWITGSSAEDLPAFAQAIYAGENVTTQGTVNVASAIGMTAGADAASQAFDEPLTTAQVTAIITPFIV
ncbi:MAG: ferritin-like domain-containing protein [Gemmatimonadaceae bacterium]